MLTPIENPANHLKIAEASTQVSTTAEVFLPHGFAAFFIPVDAVRNICSSILELCPGICLEFSLSLSRGSVYPCQLISACQGSTHTVDIAGAQVRCPSPKLSPPSLENQLPARPQNHGGPWHVTVLDSLLLLHLGAQPSPFPLKESSQEGPQVTSHCYLLPANPRTGASFIWESVF